MGYGILFYRKKKNSEIYSYFDEYKEPLIKEKHIKDLVELDNNEIIIAFNLDTTIQFLNMKSKKKTKTIKCNFCLSYSKNKMLLMNKNDLFILGVKSEIFILDIQKKEIIKEIQLEFVLSSMYKLSDNILLAGYWCNYIEQLEYDEIKKEIKVISKTSNKNFKNVDCYETSSIAILKNNLIVAPFDNSKKGGSLIIYKYKYH